MKQFTLQLTDDECRVLKESLEAWDTMGLDPGDVERFARAYTSLSAQVKKAQGRQGYLLVPGDDVAPEWVSASGTEELSADEAAAAVIARFRRSKRAGYLYAVNGEEFTPLATRIDGEFERYDEGP